MVPTIKGVPWWGAVLIGVGATTLGAVIDTVILDDSTSALGGAFKICYILGCLLAALAVRQRALFTAAAQPPLIAFIVGVVTLYTLNASSAEGMKSIVLKVVLPIATSFPWILLAFLMTLAVVAARWFYARPKGQALFGKAARRSSGSDTKRPATKPPAKKPARQSAAAKPDAKKAAAPKAASRTKASTGVKTSPAAKPATKSARPQQRPDTVKKNPQPTGDRPRTRPQATADGAPTKRTTARPSAPNSPPSSAPRSRTAQPSATGRPAPAPKRPAPSPAPRPAATAKTGAEKTADTPRRAAPQTIPARDPKAPRRTAGQLRDNGAIEDLTAGADDR